MKILLKLFYLNLERAQIICFRFLQSKGQLILKCLFGVFNLFQKTNENMSHSRKVEFIGSFFGRIHGLTICFQDYLTFKTLQRKPTFVIYLLSYIFREECSNKGGSNDGSCAAGFGVCCVCKFQKVFLKSENLQKFSLILLTESQFSWTFFALY